MRKVDSITELLQRTPPSTLYHYTSQAGLLGIITSGVLWATNIHYMSDAKEFAHAIELTHAGLSKLKNERDSADEAERALVNEFSKALYSIERVRIHVFSLSEVGDLLSQWRAYCPRGSGYSIGFDPHNLLTIMTRQGFSFFRCLYSSREQLGVLSNAIGGLVGGFRAERSASPAEREALLKKYTSEFIRLFYMIGPSLKHSAFSEEREWRMVSAPVPVGHPRLGYRQGTFMLIPHFAFSLGENWKEARVIDEIVVGPTPHMELAVSSLSEFLTRHGVKPQQITPSQVPYRLL